MAVDLDLEIPVPVNDNCLYVREMTQKLYELESFFELDALFTEYLGREVKALRLYRYLIRQAQEGEVAGNGWLWQPFDECVNFSATNAEGFNEFVTITAHEATHGVIYFLSDKESDHDRKFDLTEKDEEAFCWKVSRLVCVKLGCVFDEHLAELLFAVHVASNSMDMNAMISAHAALPERHKFLL